MAPPLGSRIEQLEDAVTTMYLIGKLIQVLLGSVDYDHCVSRNPT